MKQIETRKDEVRKKTADPREMLWQYLAADVLKTWSENFVDEASGEVVPIQRSEVMFKRGTRLDQDKITEIQFFIHCGDITEVEVSNQQRQARMVYLDGLQPWSVSAQFIKAKHRFLLYANSVQMCLDVIKDYIELNYAEPFHITTVKTFTNCIIIPDEEQLQPDEEQELPERKFYQIDVNVKLKEGGRIPAKFRDTRRECRTIDGTD